MDRSLKTWHHMIVPDPSIAYRMMPISSTLHRTLNTQQHWKGVDLIFDRIANTENVKSERGKRILLPNLNLVSTDNGSSRER